MKLKIRAGDLELDLETDFETPAQHNYDLHSQHFNLAFLTHKDAKQIIDAPVSDDDHHWFRRMTCSAAGSLQGTILLCLAGRGTDAVRIARAVDELWRRADKYNKDPIAFEKFKSDWWKPMVRFQHRQEVRKTASLSEFASTDDKIDFLQKSYKIVDDVLGKVAYTKKRDLFTEAEYDIYGLLSGYVHGDASGLLMDDIVFQSDDVPESTTMIALALNCRSVIRLMELDNAVGKLGLEHVFERAKDRFQSVLSVGEL